MLMITYLNKLEELTNFKENSVKDIILAPKELSRTGNLNLDEVKLMTLKCHEMDLRPILEWDILMVENRFKDAINIIENLDLSKFYAIRVQDPGAINYILENHPNVKIQLLLETANHNFKSIETWINFLDKRLERVVLSIELPKEILKVYLENLNNLGVSSELLGLGKVLLFYTPRSLLSAHTDSTEDQVTAFATGEDTPHKNFEVLENKHGTFMFNTKDHFLFDYISELKEMGLTYLRIDLRFKESLPIFDKLSKLMKNDDEEILNEVKKLYPGKFAKGFFRANKTDVLFKKLKNKNIGKGQGLYLGDVIDVRKKKLMGIQFNGNNLSLMPGDPIEIRTPEGKVKNIIVKEILDSTLSPIKKVESGRIFFLSHVGGVSVRSRIFKQDKI